MILPQHTHISHQLSFPKELNNFVQSHSPETPQKNQSEHIETLVKANLASNRAMAKHIYHSWDIEFKPEESALTKTKLAAKVFFTLAYQTFTESKPYPLASQNKCIGMVIVPGTKLVLIALSEGRKPEDDKPLRQQFFNLISEVNKLSKKWIFELVCVPTLSEYFILRTLSMRDPGKAPQEWIQPRTRCAEVALAVALCKTGRFKHFEPKNQGIVTFGCSLFTSEKGDQPVKYFEGAKRNTKYITENQEPIQVTLINHPTYGWLDVWTPCEEHCVIYGRAMLAIGASGGRATSFISPRSEFFRNT